MITLNTMEARVYRMVKEGKTITEMSQVLGKSRSFTTYIMYTLQRLEIVTRARVGHNKYVYTAVDVAYEEIDERPHTGVAHSEPMMQRSVLTDDQRLYLINHYKHMKRQELAKKLGIPKLRLNFEIEILREKGLLKGA